MFYPKSDYTFIKFQKSSLKNKKYQAILKNKNTGSLVKIHFGDPNYGQFEDKTGLGLYSHLDHQNPKRRLSYQARHKINNLKPYSPNYFSWYYLW